MAFNKTANLGIHIRLQNRARGGLDRLAGKLNQIRISSDKASESYRDNFFQLGVAYGVLQNGMKLLGGLRSAVEEYRGFEKAVTEVSTLVDTSKVSMEEYTKTIKDMSAAYGDLPTATAKGFYQTVSAGFTSIKDSSIVMSAGMKLAVGGATDTFTAVDGLTTILNGWNLKAKDSIDVADALFVAMREGKTTIGELSKFFGTSTSWASKSGVAYEEVAAAVATMTTAGTKSPKAFKGLTAILSAVAKGSVRSLKAAKRLGISFDMASIKAMGFQKWLQHVQLKSKGLSRNISALFGKILGVGAVLTLGPPRAIKFNKVLGDMKNRSGATRLAMSKMSNTLDFQMRKMAASWSLMKIAIGAVLKVALLPLIKMFRILVDGIRAFAEQHPKIAGMIGILLILIGTFVVLTAAVKIFEITFKITMMEVRKAFIKTALVFLANPIVLALLAIVAAIYLVKVAYDANLGGFADALDSLLSPIKTVISALWEMARTGEVTGDKVRKLFDIPGAIQLVQVISWLRAMILNFGDGFWAMFSNIQVLDPLIASFEMLGDTFSRIAELWQNIWGDEEGSKGAEDTMLMLKALGFSVGLLIGATLKVVFTIIAGLITLIGGVIEAISALIGGVITIVSGFIEILNGNFKKGVRLILSGIGQILAGIIIAILSTIYNLVANILSLVGIKITSFKKLVTGLAKYASMAFNTVLGFLSDLIDDIGDGFTYIKDLAIGIWDGILYGFNTVGAVFRKIFNKIGAGVELVKSKFNQFGNYMSDLGSTLAKPFKPLKEALKWIIRKIQWIISKKDAVVGFAQKINPVRLFKSAVGGVSSKVNEAVESLSSRVAPNSIQAVDMAGFSRDRVAAMPSTGMGQEVKRRDTQIKVQNEHTIETNISLDGRQVAKSVKTHLESMKENSLEGTNPVVSPA